ncbi:MAG TPA: benzoyl-CoA reductase subunit C [Polyangiaceae bacterium]|nr:benzoyl-CoA reductase subunit C [Polyangiaceae bacterium]
MNDPAQPVLERARALVDDRSLAAVAAWKRANPGGLAVGHLPVYVPRPLLEAIGCLPVAVFGGGDSIDIIRGDSYFQSYICHIPRSTVELGLAGDLALLDGLLFPAICDVIRNLGGMWRMLFPESYATYVDLPQNFDPEVGGRFYVLEMERIARDLRARGARPLEAEALRAAIARENARRRALLELDALRRAEPWRCRASEAYTVVRAGGALEASAHTALLEEFLLAARRREVRPVDNVRVVLVGSFCEQPPFELIRALEKSGCDIVDDDFQLGMRMIDGEIAIDDGEAPLSALARAYLERGRDSASRYIGDLVKGGALISRVRACDAEGVIFSAASFCDPALLDQPMLEAALTRAGVPHTSFKFSENTGQFQVIREQAGAFSDAVKLWGAAP